jgi:DNA sulfur modification protein DndD
MEYTTLPQIQKKLKECPYELIKELSSKRETLRNDIDGIETQIKEIENERKNRIVNSLPFIYGKNALIDSLKLIEKETKKGRIPPSIRDYFIKDLLDDGRCICGTDISKGECRKNIENLLKSVVPSKIADEADEGKYAIANIIKSFEEFKKESINSGKKLKELENDKEKKNKTVNEINVKIGKYNEKEIQNLEKLGQDYQDELINVKSEIGKIMDDIKDLDEFIKINESELKKEAKKEEKAYSIINKIEFCEKCLNALELVRREAVDSVREIIEAKTKEYFFKLIWTPKQFKDVSIHKNYTISVLSKFGIPCLGSLSAGQRQVLALSFMAALYKVSGFDMPVVIDTPLGRISEDPRENIANGLPDYLKETQVTLLATDTEYTKPVRDILLKRTGKEYYLDFNQDNLETKVKER